MSDFAIPITEWTDITEAQALALDWDQIPALTSLPKTREFCQNLECHRAQLGGLISRHLGIPTTGFVLVSKDYWIWGSYNLCLPIDIERPYQSSTLPPRAVLRFPLPFRCGEGFNPGNVEEKLRCEAATYIWLHRCCPSIPAPRLLAMGLPGTEAFTAVENESLWHRFVWQLRRCRAWFQGDTLSPLFRHERNDGLTDHGYLLLEWMANCGPLSSTWKRHRQDDGPRRANLYRGISRILLDLASVLLPRIGSWTLDGRGIISLTNRPLVGLALLWNRHEVPTDIPRDLTYTSANPFIQDMLAYHDLRLRHQTNAIHSRPDGIFQLATLVALRALLPMFWKHSSREDEFVLTLPDLHQSNILVDDDWNVVGVIDFEFAPVQPLGMVGVPLWLSDKSVDELTGPALDEYKGLHDQFIDILEEEEAARPNHRHLSKRLREDWQTGKLWYDAALQNTNAFPLIVEQKFAPRFFPKFGPDPEGSTLMRLWGEDCEEFIAAKVQDNEQYKERIRAIFAEWKQLRASKG